MSEDQIRILIVEARFYSRPRRRAAGGRDRRPEAFGAAYDVVTVPGALEIPGAIAFAEEGGHRPAGARLRRLCGAGRRDPRRDLPLRDRLQRVRARASWTCPRQAAGIGNGMLTVEDEDQAWARARRSEGDKGGGAARAALTMVALRQQLLGGALSDRPGAKQARSVARLAAVQALYQMEVCQRRRGGRDPRVLRAPLRPRLEDMAAGRGRRGLLRRPGARRGEPSRSAVDAAIAKRLAQGWRLDRHRRHRCAPSCAPAPMS